MTESAKPTAEELALAFLQGAEEAAKERLILCGEVLFDDADASELEDVFCGCDVCVVREVFAAALPHLEKHFEVLLFSRLGFEIDWGEDATAPHGE